MSNKMILEGIRVIDATGWIVGTSCSARLADFGADVIKVEAWGKGDPERGFKTFYGMALDLPDGHHAGFEVLNRNKRGIALNLEKAEGKEVMRRLVEKSDIFITNFRTKALFKLGIDYDSVARYKDDIIYVVASIFGEKGPDSDVGGFDNSGQARSGIMMRSGEPDMPPVQLVLGLLDHTTSINMAFSAIAALRARDRYGIGQKVSISMLGSAIDLNIWANGLYLFANLVHPRHDRAAPGNPLYNYYKCKDGKWILLSSLYEKNWVPFCKAVDRPDLTKDPRFTNLEKRAEHSRELTAIVDQILGSRNREEWEGRFKEFDILFAPFNDIPDLVSDPQVIANEYVTEFEHDYFGKVKYIGFPYKFSQTPVSIRGRAPMFGEHTEEVLLEIGYT